MHKPLVWILLLNYNRYDDTVECIKSIDKISYANYKILLLDNDSTDNSYDCFKKANLEVELLKSEYNMGYTGGINYGIRYLLKYNPDYILILNNDTVVSESFLDELVIGMEKEKSAAAACGTILCYHDAQKIWYNSGKVIRWRGSAKHFNKGQKFDKKGTLLPTKTNFITGCLVLLRVNILKNIGLEDERFFMYLDDIEFSMRIVNRGYSLLYVPASIIYHKVLGEKENPFIVYYATRNRLLLIETSLKGIISFIARVYVLSVMLLKLIYWFLFNKMFFKSALYGLEDYFRRNFYRGRGSLFY